MNKPAFLRRGVTLIEMLIVVGILGIILAAAAPSVADIMARRRVEMVAAELATNLAYARSEAGMRPQNVYIFFDGAGSCYSLVFWGGAGDCDCTLGAGNACSAPGVIATEFKTVQLASSTGVRLSSTDSPIMFQSRRMSASPDGAAVTVSSSRGGQLKLTVNAAGRVASCSPDGSITGVARC